LNYCASEGLTASAARSPLQSRFGLQGFAPDDRELGPDDLQISAKGGFGVQAGQGGRGHGAPLDHVAVPVGVPRIAAIPEC
jgi:hypothetical protein